MDNPTPFTKIKILENDQSTTALKIVVQEEDGEFNFIPKEELTPESKFTSDIIVSLSNGKTAGKYVNGQTIPLVGKTPQQAFNDIFIETLVPNLTNPNLGALSLNQNLLQEVGVTLPSLIATATFNRGSISPQYSASNEFRAGEVNTHIFTGGGGFTRNLSNSLNTLTRSIANYIVNLGTNIFTAQVAFNIGTQPKDSAGNDYNTALPAGNSNISSVNIQGILPFFFGNSTNIPTINQALINAGNKVVLESNETLNINFNATNKFLWFAIPNDSASKNTWYVNALNNGNIGSNSDLFGALTALSIDSPTALWLNQNYKIYVSNYATSVGLIELRN